MFLIEADIANTDYIKQYIITFSSRIRNMELRKWFVSQLYNYFVNRYTQIKVIWPNSISELMYSAKFFKPGSWASNKLKNGEQVNVIIPEDYEHEMIRVIDYLNNIGDNGRNFRMRWEDAVNLTNEWHEQLKNGMIDKDLTSEEMEEERVGTKTVYKFSDGYRWVEIIYKGCAEREGERMGHCVGGYFDQISSGASIIYSLRDPNNKPHVTMELVTNNNEILQIEGKQNKPPISKYRPYIIKFIEYLIEKNNNMRHSLVIDAYASFSNMLYLDDKSLTLYDLSTQSIYDSTNFIKAIVITNYIVIYTKDNMYITNISLDTDMSINIEDIVVSIYNPFIRVLDDFEERYPKKKFSKELAEIFVKMIFSKKLNLDIINEFYVQEFFKILYNEIAHSPYVYYDSKFYDINNVPNEKYVIHRSGLSDLHIVEIADKYKFPGSTNLDEGYRGSYYLIYTPTDSTFTKVKSIEGFIKYFGSENSLSLIYIDHNLHTDIESSIFNLNTEEERDLKESLLNMINSKENS